MFEVFGELKKQITTSGDTKPRVGSMVFFSAKLCMFITLLACVLVTAKNYIGDNIKCITGFEKQEHKAIETYCFIASTFTIVDLNADINAEGEKEEADQRQRVLPVGADGVGAAGSGEFGAVLRQLHGNPQELRSVLLAVRMFHLRHLRGQPILHQHLPWRGVLQVRAVSHQYGASGTIQKFDSMCVLPLNIVNEKTYIFLWLVYIVTAAICGFVLILHLLLFFLSSLRNTVLVHLTHKHQTKQDPTNVLLKCNYGDWFLIYHFKSNMAYFSEWVASVKQELQK
ncbi:Innexin inx1-like [Homarus americanus]|uniref:Innexin inx1-like n=1 Tax=Homarus americanus TaxID=6706 RepID=A0A8J5NB85_HOMAM|nr:Innexin inx1-like [Homarus americanus]